MSDKVKDKLNANLENAEVLSHNEVSEGIHELEMAVGPGGRPVQELAFLTGKDGPSPLRYHEGGRNISRDFIRRVDLDLLSGKPSVIRQKPQQRFQKAIDAYHSQGMYGTVIDTLTNFSAKGFKNDIDDPNIRLFFDTWNADIGFQQTVEKVFFDFFRVGMVRTFKTVGKFDPKMKPENFDRIMNQATKPGTSNTAASMRQLMAYKDFGAAKKIWSKAFVPLKYTILNPTLLEVTGSLLFDQTELFLKPEAFVDLKKMIDAPAKFSPEQRKFLTSLPKELKEAVKNNKPVKLPPELVGEVDYRRQDYERYAFPRGARTFDDLTYKEELKKADFSTLDGITNYILKITIGNDTHPVTNQTDLETVASLFDTSSKSFDIVWNHTLAIEKITSPEIDQILGKGKFEQVNDDLGMAFGVPRALLDGQATGSSKSTEIASKSFIEEINYARRSVKRWIDSEYEEVALAMGFDRYPQVRFDNLALKDEIMMMSVVQGMIDRRIISYESGIEELGFDFSTELANMLQEAPMVQAGTLGIIGSPYNQTKAAPPTEVPATTDTTPGGKDSVVTQKDLLDFQKNVEKLIQSGIQPTQKTPTGTPSEGRPRGKPAATPKKSTKPTTKPRKPRGGPRGSRDRKQ